MNGGSHIYIEGQFGDVGYPESAAPVVLIGATPCEVDLDDSTARVTHCITQPLYAADLAAGLNLSSGVFQLPLTLYTPQARETDRGIPVAAPNEATCSIPDDEGGCYVQFDADSSPRVDSIRTGSLKPGSVLRINGTSLESGNTDPPGYNTGIEIDGGTGGSRRGRRMSEDTSVVSEIASLEVKIKVCASANDRAFEPAWKPRGDWNV